MNSKVLEALLIPDNTIALESILGFNKSISKAQIERSPYYKMNDRELATRMVDGLNNNLTIELAPKTDPSVAKPLQLMRLIAYDYYEYMIGGIPVAVARANNATKEPSFTVYAYVPKNNRIHREHSSQKSNILK